MRHVQSFFAALALSTSAAAQCFGPSREFALPGVDGTVHAFAWFDDGQGPRLYVGGEFRVAGASQANHLARWTGSYWEGVPGGTGGTVYALTVHDDGGGDALYVGGYFPGAAGITARNVVRFDGAAWSPVGPGFSEQVRALLVHDDGSGPRLFAAGQFRTLVDGTTMRGIAAWDGAAWSEIGGGLGIFGVGLALHAVDEGGARVLYLAGEFESAGGVSARSLARWDGTTWTAPQPAVSGGVSRSMRALETFGGALYVGGVENSGGWRVKLSRWDGSTWTELLDSPTTSALGGIEALSVFDDGSGPTLAIGGGFTNLPTTAARHLATFDGSAFGELAGGTNQRVLELAVDGASTLLVGGELTRIGTTVAPGIGSWNGVSAASVGTGLGLGRRDPQNPIAQANEACVHDDGNGDALYVTGIFGSAGAQAVDGIARFDGTSWSSIQANLSTCFGSTLTSHDDGQGPRLYVGGTLNLAGSLFPARLVRWDGGSWTDVGSSMSGTVTCVRSLQVGSQRRLYVGGTFPNFVRVWDGAAWSSLPMPPFAGSLADLESFDDGTGAALVATDGFTVRRFDGSTWTTVGAMAPFGYVRALFAWDDGAGEALFACGDFQTISGVPAKGVARFDGTTWSPLPALPASIPEVNDLVAFDDGEGAGATLWACGRFDGQSGVLQLAGGVWSFRYAATTTINASPLDAWTVFDDGTGPSLFVTGLQQTFDGHGASRIERIHRSVAPGCEARTGEVFCAGDGSGGACPCGNAGGAGRGCDNSSSTGGARLQAFGQAHVASDHVALVASGMPSSTIALVFQGDASVAGGNGAPFGDGLRCVGGSVVRLVVRAVVNGSVAFGGSAYGDAPLALAGGVPANGGLRRYQAWYRDAQSFCTSSTFNLSNGLAILWAR